MAKTTGENRVRKKALDAALRTMFDKLQARPLPERITDGVKQLDDGGRRVKKAG